MAIKMSLHSRFINSEPAFFQNKGKRSQNLLKTGSIMANIKLKSEQFLMELKVGQHTLGAPTPSFLIQLH
jgi:hypothetical protein